VLDALFQSPRQRRLRSLVKQGERLGWAVEAVDDASATFRPPPDGEMVITVVLVDDDGEPDTVLMAAGPPRLNALLVPVCDTPDASRAWLGLIHQQGPLAHHGPAPAELRAALNEALAHGLPPAALNDYAQRLGGGGADGVVRRFAEEAVERTFSNPNPPSGTELLDPPQFGFAVAWVGNRPLIGAPGLDRFLPNGTPFGDAGAA
jgi:catechol 2,3-dioxygenase-like lactoylglutathione lyase family enzyme